MGTLFAEILYDDDGDEHHDNLPTYSCVVAAFSRFRGFQIEYFVFQNDINFLMLKCPLVLIVI